MLIIAEKCGQLGNRLVLGAHAIALASEFGWRLSYPAFDDYASFFQGPSEHRTGFSLDPQKCDAPLLASSYLLTHMAMRLIHKFGLGNRMVDVLGIPGGDPSSDVDLALPQIRQRIESARVTLVLGWRIRNYPLVAKHQSIIRQYFQPVASIRNRVTELLADVRATSRPLVGIHIRQGDFRAYQGGRHFHETSTYVRFMTRLRELLPNPAFLVCSSESQPVELFADLDVRWGPGRAVDDLHALSQCDFIVGVPSTFCRWAAFHGQRRLFLIGRPEPESLTLDSFEQQGDAI